MMKFITEPDIFVKNINEIIKQDDLKIKDSYEISYSSFSIIFDKKESEIKKTKILNNSLSTSNSSFNIASSYENLNILSQGKYINDNLLQNKLKLIILNKENEYKKLNELKEKDDIGEISTKQFNLSIKELLNIKNETKELRMNKFQAKKNALRRLKSSNNININIKKPGFLSRINDNIKESNEKLNRPDEFYKKLFSKIMKKHTIVQSRKETSINGNKSERKIKNCKNILNNG